MRNGEKIWHCKRLSEENAEVSVWDKPHEHILRMPSAFSPIGITVQPKNGFTDRFQYGETTNSDQRVILTPYVYWQGKFQVGDLFYVDGQKPTAEEEYYGQNANYQVEFVALQNEAIELSLKQWKNNY